MAIKDINDLKEYREKTFGKLKKKLEESMAPQDRMFYLHSSEDRILLSHVLFWVMSRSLKGKIAKEKFFLLIRKYQEKMLNTYLMDDDYFYDLLYYCNIQYEYIPVFIRTLYDMADKNTRKLAAICIVAAGYAGDMTEIRCYELLDDMDFVYNKVKCRKIEQMLPTLNKMVEHEMEHF